MSKIDKGKAWEESMGHLRNPSAHRVKIWQWEPNLHSVCTH